MMDFWSLFVEGTVTNKCLYELIFTFCYPGKELVKLDLSEYSPWSVNWKSNWVELVDKDILNSWRYPLYKFHYQEAECTAYFNALLKHSVMSRRIKSSISGPVVSRFLLDIAAAAGVNNQSTVLKKISDYVKQRCRPDNDSRLDKVMLQSLFNVITMRSEE